MSLPALEQIGHIADRAIQIVKAVETDATALERVLTSGLDNYLLASEKKLILLMTGQKPSESLPGSVEFGLVLYWIHKHLSWLAALLQLPPTQVTDQMVEQWEEVLRQQGVVHADGTLCSYTPYAQLDPNWMYSAITYIATLVTDDHAPFGTSPSVRVIKTDDPVRIAVTGDWGTGNWADGPGLCPALAVKQQIVKSDVHITIHLGDVYYSGWASEEQMKLLDLWYAGPWGTYTLNSNHEFYDGSKGYFLTALAAPMFVDQQKTSYFAIDGGAWMIIGLDSAYYSKSLLNMTGAITDPAQITFLKNLDITGKTVIVMTHHNGLALDGATKETLWTDVHTALGRDPDFWYWGHTHNGIVYKQTPVTGATKARCVGHGAIPFGSAYELLKVDGITPIDSLDWVANTPYPHPTIEQKNRVLNGFVLLTLTATTLKEDCIDQMGTVAWSKEWTLA